MQVQYFRDLARVPSTLKGAVLAIGNFDGLHSGHQAVLTAARVQAERLGKPLLLATFEPASRAVCLRPSRSLSALPLRLPA